MKIQLNKTSIVTIFITVLLLVTMQVSALEGVVLIVNPGVATPSLTSEALKDILIGNTKYWDGGQNIVIAYIPEKSDAALKSASGMDTSEFKTFWQRLVFSGRGQEPKRVGDEASLVKLVATTKGAMALVPASITLTGVKKVEVK